MVIVPIVLDYRPTRVNNEDDEESFRFSCCSSFGFGKRRFLSYLFLEEPLQMSLQENAQGFLVVPAQLHQVIDILWSHDVLRVCL